MKKIAFVMYQLCIAKSSWKNWDRSLQKDLDWLLQQLEWWIRIDCNITTIKNLEWHYSKNTNIVENSRNTRLQ